MTIVRPDGFKTCACTWKCTCGAGDFSMHSYVAAYEKYLAARKEWARMGDDDIVVLEWGPGRNTVMAIFHKKTWVVGEENEDIDDREVHIINGLCSLERHVATFDFPEDAADAVRAVNCHDELVEAAEEAHDLLRHHHGGLKGQVYMRLGAVLAKVKGET